MKATFSNSMCLLPLLNAFIYCNKGKYDFSTNHISIHYLVLRAIVEGINTFQRDFKLPQSVKEVQHGVKALQERRVEIVARTMTAPQRKFVFFRIRKMLQQTDQFVGTKQAWKSEKLIVVSQHLQQKLLKQHVPSVRIKPFVIFNVI